MMLTQHNETQARTQLTAYKEFIMGMVHAVQTPVLPFPSCLQKRHFT